ncbi:MAG: class I poly(R)-hydroxyalkanoic acid synthase, partial [Rhodoferax sp.]|nr:class I poly(R)-hydroxyalkanoic acid synthase [Rhodoferax sp.]
MNSEVQQQWLQNAQQFQQTMTESFGKMFESFQNMDLGQAAAPLMGVHKKAPKITFNPEKMQALQQQYLQEAGELWAQGLQGKLKLNDRRFADPAWSTNPMAAFSAAVYLLNAKTMMQLVDAVETDEKTRARLRFTVEQLTAATAPSNFMLFNAEAQKKAIETKGESISKGIQNLLHDMQQGHVSMTDESLFHVGKNVATTEGAVVFENDFFQLIEYKPLTDKVYEKPFLMVPPSINKFYILDLQPENSLVRYAVAQGHRTFMVSWRNPDASMAKATWDDFIEHAIIKAISVTQEVTGASSINALG